MFLLPPIRPLSSHPLCYSPPQPSGPPDPRNPNQQPHPNQQHHHAHHTTHQPPSLRTPLAALASDEALIAYRKRALARYGANWLRPPGVVKTLQGQDDERAEREEAEAQREQEERAQMEMMAAREMEAEEMDEGEEGEGEEGGEGGAVDLDAEVPDADAEGGEWSSDEEEEEEEDEEEGQEEDGEEEDEANTERSVGTGRRPIAAGMYDGPSTPEHDDDRTPQRYRLNPYQVPGGEGDGDYGSPLASPLAARHMQRAANARVEAAGAALAAATMMRGGTTAGPVTPAGPGAAIDMDADLDDAIPMEETMIEDDSFDQTDSEGVDMSSADEGLPGGSVGVGSRSVFSAGAIGAAVRRISGQERRASGRQSRGGGDRRISGGDRRASGRSRHG